jgi:hypothetical protein
MLFLYNLTKEHQKDTQQRTRFGMKRFMSPSEEVDRSMVKTMDVQGNRYISYTQPMLYPLAYKRLENANRHGATPHFMQSPGHVGCMPDMERSEPPWFHDI